MDLKIICPCGAHFAFEVEPENGRMPQRVACPECGADATDLANEQIQTALGLGSASQAPSPAPSARSALRVGSSPTVNRVVPDAVPTPGDAPPHCAKHPTEAAVAECAVCGKPICQGCLEQFGFLCSVYCRQQAENQGLAVPVYGGTRQRQRRRERHKELRILAAIAVLLLLLGAAAAYYVFYASQPRPAWSAAAPAGQGFSHASWVGDDRILALNGESLALLEAASGRTVWTARLKPEESLLKDSFKPPLQLTKDAAWVVFANRAARFQLTDGQRKTEVPFPAAIESFAFSENALLAASSPKLDQETVTWVDLTSGQARSETFARPVQRPTPLSQPSGDADPPISLPRSPDHELTAAARGGARLSQRLLQHVSVPLTAPGEREAPSVLEKESLRAGDSDRAGAEFMRGSAERRQIDLSRYAAVLHWFGSNPAADWRADVIGRPALFPLATVNVLVAGTNLTVFSADGARRWESHLPYPIDERFLEEQERHPEGPCRESSGRLYVADLGNLNAFDLDRGQVLWRIQAVGIRDVQPAPGGILYVAATTAGPQGIAYVNPHDADLTVQPLLLKLDAAGQILWRQVGMGERCLPAGKFLYVTRSQTSSLDQFKAGVDGSDPQVHFRVHRVDPKNGRLLWEYYQPRPPLVTAANRNRFFLLFRDKLQMVRFTSL